MRTVISVLLINMLLALVYPQKVYSYSESRQSELPSTFANLNIPEQSSLYLQGQEPPTALYLPIIVRKNLPPRENITLSALSESVAPESYEKNVDSNGIPILVEGFTNGNGYHPTYICRYALYMAATYYEVSPDSENYQKVQNLMTWIRDNRVERDKFITWEFYEDLPSHNQTAPWTSALTNAWCSGALLLGYKITGDEELETLARAGLEYLFTPLTEGGGLYEFENGDIWFEEYPSIEYPSHVLNGFIYAVEVVDMFYSYYGSDRYKDFFDRAVSSLVNRIDLFDVEYGSIYDLYTRANKLGMAYHKLHILQLYYLYLRTGNSHLLEVSQKWYALQYQSEYELLISPSTKKVTSIIHDGIYWYNYVLLKLPVELTFDFVRTYDLDAVNFFLYRDNNPTESLSISYRAEDGSYIEIPPANYTVEWAGSNTTPNGHITNVYTLSFDSPIRTQSLRIKIEKTISNDAGVFREIGILKNMNYEYQEEYNRMQYMKDIVSKRIQLAGP